MEISLVFVVCLITAAAAQTTQIIGGCGDTSYYGPFGVITSPNYPGNYYDNLLCDYYIYASTGSSFTIIFKSLNTQTNADTVTISCPTNLNFTQKVYSGNVLPDPISISWCSQGRINFRTDFSIVYSGFSLDYSVSVGGCGNTLYTGSNGYVTSPNWPNDYGENQNCSNIIFAAQRNTFHLDFQSFDLQSNCTYDWLEISCLDNSDYGPFRYCGSIANYSLDVHGCSQLLLWFHSDNSENHEGFNIEYSVYPAEGCGNVSYNGPSGVISSPNHPGLYVNNLYCEYYIKASSTSSFTLIFTSFNVEDGLDFVTISCPTNASFPPQEYTGNVLPDPVSVTWCSQGLVYFKSDYSTVSTGFSLDYIVSEGGCGNTLYTKSYGNVTSPNWPGFYGAYHDCFNIIWAPQPSTFYLNCQFFNLHSCCDCDYLEISCLDNSAYGPYKFCGYQSSFDIEIHECSRVLLWFHSDGYPSGAGFNIQYNTYSDAGNMSVAGTTVFPPTTPTSPGNTSVAGTTVFPPTTPTSPGSTASTSTTTARTTTVFVPQSCGNTSYYGPSGVISSPSFPGNYSNDLSCDYYINASSSSSSIAIIFEAFDTEQCCDYLTISCPTNSIYPSVRYSGSSLPQPVSIPWCSKAAVNFSTDSSVVSTGFSMDYHISLGGCGDTVYTGSHGYVTSPNYPNSYDNNQNCSNVIWSRLRSSFSITFQYMNVEECCDFVELSCLDNAEYGSQRFTGTTIPPKQDIPQCTQVLVWFYSDDSAVHEGFNLEYTATPDSDE